MAHQSTRMLVCLMAVLVVPGDIVSAALANGVDLMAVLKQTTNDALGVDAMQAYLDENAKATSTPADKRLLDEVKSSISAVLTSRLQLVKDSKTTIESIYPTFSYQQSVPECCNMPDHELEYDARFKTKVSYKTYCMKKSAFAPSNPKTPDQIALLDHFKRGRVSVPSVLWQYYGSEEGVTFIHPASKAEHCSSHDPRFRPWYVGATTPFPKDVVIVIDRSGSMGVHLMNLAKEAAKTIIDTLNYKDRVGAVAFSSTAHTAGGPGENFCYFKQLAVASNINKNYLKNYVDSISATGSTFYHLALKAAFALHKGTPSDDNQNRRKVILFLTDGKPNDDNYLETIRTENALLGNNISLLTFGVGASITGEGETILRNMAKLHQNTPGVFTFIDNQANLRRDMGTYYAYFGNSEYDTPLIDLPFLEASGTGMVLSATLPIWFNNQFKGVTGVDIGLADLTSSVSYSFERTFAFIINEKGWILSHPLLPIPTAVTNDPVTIHIKDMETSAGVHGVIDKMIGGLSGSQRLSRTYEKSRGRSHVNGIDIVKSMATYHYGQISIAKLSICVVINDAETSDDFSTTSAPANIPFLYHRLDLKPPKSPCRFFSRYAVKGDTAVKFAPASFKDPVYYLQVEETPTLLKQYADIITGVSSNTLFKDGVVEEVALSGYVNQLWFTPKAEQSSRNVIWKFMGTEKGVNRRSPVVQSHKNYDPTARAWYRQAKSNGAKLTVVAPYAHSQGSGDNVDIHRTLFIQSKLFGIMGIAITVQNMYYIMYDTYAICKDSSYRCFLMDTSGYIVTHPDFIKHNALTVNVHITRKEGSVADDLINKKILVMYSCTDLYTVKKYYFFKTAASVGSITSSWPEYELHELVGSNIILGVVRSTASQTGTNCYSPPTSSLGNCVPQNKCNHPCYNDADFSRCINRYNTTMSDWAVCYPDPPKTNMSSELAKERDAIKHLHNCYDYHCGNRTDASSCYQGAGCSVCGSNCCNLTLPTSTPHDEVNLNGWGLRGIIIGSVSGIIFLLVIIIFFIAKCRKKGQKTRHQADPAPGQEQGPTSTTRSADPAPLTATAPPPNGNTYYYNGAYEEHPGYYSEILPSKYPVDEYLTPA